MSSISQEVEQVFPGEVNIAVTLKKAGDCIEQFVDGYGNFSPERQQRFRELFSDYLRLVAAETGAVPSPEEFLVKIQQEQFITVFSSKIHDALLDALYSQSDESEPQEERSDSTDGEDSRS